MVVGVIEGGEGRYMPTLAGFLEKMKSGGGECGKVSGNEGN